MSKRAVVGRVKKLQPCDTCGKWLRTGWKVYKWWPTGEEVGRYPKVWVCRDCFAKLINGTLRPKPLSLDVELHAAETKIDIRTPVEPPPDVVTPTAKSPMSARR